MCVRVCECVRGLRVYLSDVLSWMPIIQMTMTTTTRTDEKLLHCESTVRTIRRLLRFLWGVKKPERCFRQPGHEASDEEAQDTAEPRAPTDDDERVRECVDERRRWGA